MITHTRSVRATSRWCWAYGTLSIVAAYVVALAHLGQPAIPGHLGLALVGVLTWVALEEALAQTTGAQVPHWRALHRPQQ